MLSRLRAVFTPQVLAIFVIMALFALFAKGKEQSFESRVSRTLSAVEGAGRVEVVIRTRDTRQSGGMLEAGLEEKTPVGAVAVAQGADDPLVALALHEALCALLDLSADSVSVIAGGN